VLCAIAAKTMGRSPVTRVAAVLTVDRGTGSIRQGGSPRDAVTMVCRQTPSSMGPGRQRGSLACVDGLPEYRLAVTTLQEA